MIVTEISHGREFTQPTLCMVGKVSKTIPKVWSSEYQIEKY